MKTLQSNIPTLTDTFSKPSDSQRTSTYKWRQLRLSILQRDKYTCQSCGNITTVLEVDHINADSSNNDPSNLQSLCRPCHEAKTLKENTNTESYHQHLAKLKTIVSKYK